MKSEDGLHDVEEYLDGRAKQTAAATEQVLDGLLGEGGDGDTSAEGVCTGPTGSLICRAPGRAASSVLSAAAESLQLDPSIEATDKNL